MSVNLFVGLQVIEPMARDGLRTISLAYRDFVPGKAEINQVKLRFMLIMICSQFGHCVNVKEKTGRFYLLENLGHKFLEAYVNVFLNVRKSSWHVLVELGDLLCRGRFDSTRLGESRFTV